MSISFNNISESVRASNNFIELAGVRKSLAGLFIPPIGAIVGQYDPAKTSVVDYLPVKVVSPDDGASKFGFGSHLHRQLLRLPSGVFLQGGGIYCFPIPEEVAGVAATDTITVTGTATSAGTLYFSIAGDSFSVGISSGDDPTAIGDAIEAKITSEIKLPITASNAIGVVTNTAKFKGTAGNQIYVKVNPAGESQSDKNPAGVTIALGNADGYLSSGATDPDIEDMFFDSNGDDVLGDRWYTAMSMPWTDATSIGYHKLSAEKRFDPAVARFFGSYGAYTKETYAAALALPATINSEFIGIIWENRAEYPSFELAAELVGIILNEQNKAPNRPYKTVDLSGPADTETVNRSYNQNDALFRAGMSYCYIDTTGSLRLGDIALTYRTNDAGGAATDWFDAVSLHSRQAKAYSVEQLFLADKYTRAVVVDNNQPTAVEYAIAPKDVVADLTKLILDLWAPNAWSKNIDTILESISAEINAGNESRIDNEFEDDEAKALRIIATRLAFLF